MRAPEEPLREPVLLLTSTILPGNTPYLQLCDPRERLLEYIMSLLLWIETSTVRTLLFCDNSGRAFDLSSLELLAEANDKVLRVFQLSEDRDGDRGKGHGESKALAEAICEGHLVDGSSAFFKVSGRLFVSNFEEVERAHHDLPVVFGQLPWHLDTRFWKATPQFYKEHLASVYHEVNDLDGVYIEHVYARRMQTQSVADFLVTPRFVGRSGTNLSGYDAWFSDDVRDHAETLCSEVWRTS